MHAWFLMGNGVSGLTLREVEQPQPGPGEVAIQVEAASLNFRDLVIAGDRRVNNHIPLSDGAGLIISVGRGVVSVAPGDRVAACFFPHWTDGRLRRSMHEAELGGSVDGMLAEVVIMPAAAVVPVPLGWSSQRASTLPCAALSMECAQRRPAAATRPNRASARYGRGIRIRPAVCQDDGRPGDHHVEQRRETGKDEIARG